MDINLPNNWQARSYQKPAWNYLSTGGKRAVLAWPRRHGKDDLCLTHIACAMTERKGTYWYLLPEYAQARKSMWDAIDEERGSRRIDLIFPEAIRTLYREQEMMLGYCGSTLQFLGADNFHSLVGSPPVGVGFSEYARTDPSAWAYIMPIIEKNGGFAMFNSTPYGDNHFKKFCEYADKQMTAGKDWFYQRLTADDCNVYSRAQLDEIKDQLCATHGDDYGMALFLQEYYTAFDAAIPGSIWGDCLDKARREGRIHPFVVDRKLPVYTGWDIGRADDTAIWFYQILHGELLIFDFHASSLKDIAFYCDLLEAKRDEYGITYARHWLPHDARPRVLASGAGSMLQQMNEAARRNPKLGQFAIAKRLDKQEQIQAGRATLPICRFHDTRTAEGVKALRHYHRVWDEELRKFADVAVHDWASHPADAFMTVATTWKLSQPESSELPMGTRLLGGNPVKERWGSFLKRHLDRRRSERELVA
jgi:hypothetical protein